MDEKLCEMTHKHINEKLGEHDKRLEAHGGQIDEIQKDQVRTDTTVGQLCDQISKLVDEMAKERDERHVQERHLLWAIIGGFGSIALIFLGFIFWYIQQLPM